jgi:hypothetical protein
MPGFRAIQRTVFAGMLLLLVGGCLEQAHPHSARAPLAQSSLSGDSPEPATDPADPSGALEELNPVTGTLRGYAYDPNTLDQAVDVEFYLNDAPTLGGRSLGKASASLGRTAPPAGPYAFAFQMPAEYVNGRAYRVRAYARDTADSANLVELAGSPFLFYAGTNSRGLEQFNQKLGAAFAAQCASCHADAADYAAMKARLGSPSPFAGGSAVNNAIYAKIIGNAPHAGGVACRPAGALCVDVRDWWEAEFSAAAAVN